MKHRLNILIALNIFILLVIVALIGFALRLSPSIDQLTSLTLINSQSNSQKEIVKEDNLPEFNIYTSAVCDNISGFNVCHDELFAKCGDAEYRLPKITGERVFDEDWKDPRK